ncbi:hypothetical protein HK405_009567 [Cladochytrium tenue]|nr:hypothetical protein HK405_009567 [Cladochytrium tenue]
MDQRLSPSSSSPVVATAAAVATATTAAATASAYSFSTFAFGEASVDPAATSAATLEAASPPLPPCPSLPLVRLASSCDVSINPAVHDNPLLVAIVEILPILPSLPQPPHVTLPSSTSFAAAAASPTPSTPRPRPPPADYAGSRLAQLAVQVMTRLVAPRWKVDDAGPQFAATPLAHPAVARHLDRLRRFAAIALRSPHPGAAHMTLYALLLVQRLLTGPAVPSLPSTVLSSSATPTPAPLPATLSSPTRLLLAGLVLAESQLADAQTSCAIWARAAGVPQGARGVAALKRDALAALRWDVAVPATVYANWTVAVRAAIAPPAIPLQMPMPLVPPPPVRRTASPRVTAAAVAAVDDRTAPLPGSPATTASPARAADTPPRRPQTGGWSS